MLKCECEHSDHFEGRSHPYEQAEATKIAKTPFGPFPICPRCDEIHYGAEFPTFPITSINIERLGL